MFLAGFELVCGAAAAFFVLFVVLPVALGVGGAILTLMYQRAKRIKLIWIAIPTFLFSAIVASDTANSVAVVLGLLSACYLFAKFIDFLIPDHHQNKKAA